VLRLRWPASEVFRGLLGRVARPYALPVRHVVLIGPMGAGKTTIGRLVAKALKRRFVDNDVALEQRTGRTAAQIAASDGVDALHGQEAAEMLAALADPTGRVIAAAASVILDESVRGRLAELGWVVWLTAGQATLAARMPSSDDRPTLDADVLRLVARQSSERDPLFRRVAALEIVTDEVTPAEAVAQILEHLPVVLQAGTPS
jgi:shikimate kinase